MSTDNNIRIYYNGNILTVDDRFSTCTAMATQGDRILAMGSDAELLALKDRAVASYDLYGRTVMPGLNDMHAHMDREGLKTVYPSLAGAKSIEDILARIAELVKAAKPGEWIVTMPIGNPPSYWTPQDELKEKRWPTRWDLDQVSPNNPVYIRPIWGFWRHALPITSIANSRALEVCGINRNTPSPAPSVVIEKDSNGEPTGIFNEDTYMSVVEMTLMRPAGGFTHKDRVAALGRAMDAYVSFGTTSVYEEHGAAGELIAAYRTLRESGPLTVRANLLFSPSWSTVPGADPERLLGSWGAWLGGRGLGDNYLRTSGLYALLEAEGDGGPRSPLENSLRASANPYTGWAGFHYDAGLPRDQLKKVLIAAARNDIRGVALTADVLDIYEEVNRVVPIRDKRWVIGHVSLLTKDEIARMRDLGIVTSTHTNRYIWRTGQKTLNQVGAANEDTISPLANMKEAGVRFCLATDNVPVSLFYPVWQSVARKDRVTGNVIAPSQKISRQDALRAATINGAYLTFEEKEKGSLEVGKLADFVCLNANPMSVAEDDLKELKAEFTVVGGRTVYGDPSLSSAKAEAAQ
ncbi:MAG TPA: amidohydrolase [Pseudolabrys sp.]|nr:amidohydrolase [Pseudolabrys sp.]